jgi:hypothetical protein
VNLVAHVIGVSANNRVRVSGSSGFPRSCCLSASPHLLPKGCSFGKYEIWSSFGVASHLDWCYDTSSHIQDDQRTTPLPMCGFPSWRHCCSVDGTLVNVAGGQAKEGHHSSSQTIIVDWNS